MKTHIKSSFGENEFVAWIRQTMPTSRHALIHNGDDAALLETSHRGMLVATDMLLDGTHFKTEDTPPELIGRKLVAVNLSDIAAMGGWPESVFISLGIPQSLSRDWIERLMIGAAAVAREFGCGIDGGDTNRWAGPLVINACVTGRPHWRGAVKRSGAKEGDAIMVTGLSLGHSLDTQRHLTFTPRLKEARWLLDHAPIHSMMDLSDGLGSDLPRLARASGVHMTLDAHKLLNHASTSLEELHAALGDGEDFELVFTCSPQDAISILKHFPFPCGVRMIGTVKKGQGVYLSPCNHGHEEPLAISGYEH